MIDLISKSKDVTFCNLVLYQNPTDVVGTTIDINTETCDKVLSNFDEVLDLLKPFGTKTSTQPFSTIDTSKFVRNSNIRTPSEEVLEYLLDQDWYCILNDAQVPSLEQAIDALEGVDPSYSRKSKYDIHIDREIVHPNSVIYSYSNTTKQDTIQMQLTKVTDANQVNL